MTVASISSDQIHEIQTFIASELARGGNARCEQIELINGDNLGRDPTPIRTWDGSALCRQSPGIAGEIMDTANAVAAEIGPGRHRFLIKSHLKDGGRQILWFTISSRQEEETMSDPYRTGHPPDVKINWRVADLLLRHLEKLLNDDQLDSETRRRALAECYHTLRTALETAQGGTIASLMEAATKENARLLEATVKETDKLYDSLAKMVEETNTLKETLAVQAAKHERITQMAATIAAGIWARNDPALDLGSADSKLIVAKLARATAELILQQEAMDAR